jgi:hypothetical protein
MRRCHISDLLAAARCVAAAAPNHRAGLIEQLLTQSDAAHRYAKRFGRAHPHWGNGSLMSRALLALPPEISPHSAAFYAALAQLSARLAQRKAAP